MKLFRNGVRVWALAIAVPALGLMTTMTGRTAAAQVSIGISVNSAPPELPVYEQPLCPGEGYIWTPGYWAWDPDYGDYYWVPGTWVLAPQPGYLWTPPYWGWSGVAFVFHEGYWGPRVGFYGGINYGYGYTGRGYYGGRWERDRFYYNRSVNNVNVTQIHNVYNKTVVNNINVTRVSYNGGNGGIREHANRQEQEAARERHMGGVATQQQHVQEARSDRALRASDNHGKPPIAATDRPGQFRGGNVVAAKEGKYNPPPNRANNANRPDNANRQPEANRPGETARPENRVDRNDRPPNARGPENNANRPTYVHPNDVPKANRPDRPPSSGNAKADQKYQQRNDNMYKKQEQDRQNLQKKQDQQHARAEQQRADDTRKQQMEKQHQQQTQKMEQRQQQQQQKMERQAPKPQPQPKQQPPKQQQAPPHDKKP